MAKKKKQNPNATRNMVRGIVIAVLAVVLITGGSVGIYAWDQTRRSWIGTVHGERVNAGEFRLNLLEQQIQFEDEFGPDVWLHAWGDLSFIDIAKEEAFSRTMTTRLAAMKAAEHGVNSLTDEQADIVEQMVDVFINVYDPQIMRYIGLTENELRQSFANGFYAENLFTMLGEQLFVHDEEAMLEEFTELFEQTKLEDTIFTFYSITHYDYELMQDIHAQLMDGADFYTMMARHCLVYHEFNPDAYERLQERLMREESAEEIAEESQADDTEEENDPEIIFEGDEFAGLELDIDWEDLLEGWDPSMITLQGSQLLEEIDFAMAQAIFAMSEGEISDIVTITDPSGWNPDAYTIINLITVVEPDFDEELLSFEQFVFIPRGQAEAVGVLLEVWIEEAEITRNDRAFDTITLFAFR